MGVCPSRDWSAVRVAKAQSEDVYTFMRQDAARQFGRGSHPAFRLGDGDQPNLSIRVTPRGTRHASGGQMVCVRTCDGFYFPVGGGDPSVAEFVCRASCPGAPVQVFTRRGADIEDAVGPDKSPYRTLATALDFRKQVTPSCSCRPQATARTGPVYDDPTLRAGDVLVVDGRAVVFKGAAQRPYGEKDFAPIERSRLVSDAGRHAIGLLLLSYRAAGAVKSKREEPARDIASAPPRTPAMTAADAIRVVLPFKETDPPTVPAFAPQGR